MLPWFYDFWLSVFHIITPCSALGVKELMLQLLTPVRKRRRATFPRRLFTVLLSSLLRGNRYKALVGHLMSIFSIVRLSRCCSSQPHAISARPSAFLDTLSLIIFDLSASTLIILYYSVLSCIPIPYLVNLFVSPQIVAAVFNYFGVPCFPFLEAWICGSLHPTSHGTRLNKPLNHQQRILIKPRRLQSP